MWPATSLATPSVSPGVKPVMMYAVFVRDWAIPLDTEPVAENATLAADAVSRSRRVTIRRVAMNRLPDPTPLALGNPKPWRDEDA
jgi:hypothetical protein